MDAQAIYQRITEGACDVSSPSQRLATWHSIRLHATAGWILHWSLRSPRCVTLV